MDPENGVAQLRQDRSLLGRTSITEQVADLLRARITAGLFEPGDRLDEVPIAKALNVSRNTLREAFRLLSHERLLVHELNRGVFVRKLTAADVADVYRVRRVVEGAAVRRAAAAPPGAVAALRAAIEDGRRAAAAGDWREVGTANIRFHQALTAMHDSPRLDDVMRQLFAELRLVFHVMENPRAFHEPFVARNQELLDLIEAGEVAEAERRLADYLDHAESLLREAYTPEE
ncbi:GntR family transcriptional regulator [Bailinhaonella thermotolerans]|uniref:GntR family transcriptional regulator n=1 Tax=Bailinhaonella thermotolerans TaxID=1070861 RepID=A0A3A4AWL4_9ACTN|nr:GntR family transcriptional regulator [Bailinhaonella thermotolerans]RJL34325.1 GntR family transcriptional regulator [Bailinhaonella thermotolerans]